MPREMIPVLPGELCAWFEQEDLPADLHRRGQSKKKLTYCGKQATKKVKWLTPEMQAIVPLCAKHNSVHNNRESLRRNTATRRA